MTQATVQSRIKRIQKHLNVPADGLIGPATLTALENRLFTKKQLTADQQDFSLTVSAKGLSQLVKHEISSAAYYRRFLSNPVWPGGQSGVTIGVGYDLGYNSASQIRKDWAAQLSELELAKLTVVAGLKGQAAEQAVKGVKDIQVPLENAEQVFYAATLPRYAKQTRKAYPGVEKLFADAQAALLSLVYNRGAKMTGSSRKEMAAIKQLVVNRDYAGIAEQIKAMKRLWENRGLDGLLKRRDDEARLVRNADRDYEDDELVRV